MLLELALDEDYLVRKTISEVVESQKASPLIFEQILQDCVSSKIPEMMNLVIVFYKNLQKVSKSHLLSGISGGAWITKEHQAVLKRNVLYAIRFLHLRMQITKKSTIFLG